MGEILMMRSIKIVACYEPIENIVYCLNIFQQCGIYELRQTDRCSIEPIDYLTLFESF